MKIKFLGAAGTVTGSGYLLESNSGQQVVIDLGLFQGTPDIENLNHQDIQVNVSKLSAVILTHAHLDHCGRVPILIKNGFRGLIYMTAPTIELAELTLLDSAKVSREDNPDRVLYEKDDVRTAVQQFRAVDYNYPLRIGDFTFTYRDAGHILGSASIEVAVDGKHIVFSGDLGNTPEDLTEPTQFISSADFVVMESTYGGRTHPEGEAADMICTEINAVEVSDGALLIPAFSLERTQELLHIISHLKSAGKIKSATPVFLDSPMAEKATNIYGRYKSFLNDEINKDFSDSDPFYFPGLEVIETRQDSASLSRGGGVRVIIAGGGMMSGGRIVNHAKALLSSSKNRLAIVGYQGEGTLGRELASGAKQVEINGDLITVNAPVVDIQVMSSHADEPKLINWLSHIQSVRKVILTHGEDEPRQILAEKIRSKLAISDISMPHLNEEIILPTD